MPWSIAEAKQKFSEVLRAAATAPQLICNRGRLVAVVVNVETFHAFQAWYEQKSKTTLAEAFAELRALCAAEEYTLAVPLRHDRGNPFAEALDDVSG